LFCLIFPYIISFQWCFCIIFWFIQSHLSFSFPLLICLFTIIILFPLGMLSFIHRPLVLPLVLSFS
jgi:hypothetical protein